MTAIETKYHGPTNTRGARITAKALATGQKISISYPYDLSGVECHRAAIHQFLGRFHNFPHDSGHQWQAGETPTGYVFVWVPCRCVEVR